MGFSRSISILPPLGKLINPYSGAIQNERETESADLVIKGCKASVDVYYDERSVAHVFAQNDHDMFLAQGYLTAKDRLWQMDFMSYASAGRLSEVLGQGYVDFDRLQRRLGMLSSAKSTLQLIEQNPETRKALDAYTSGVNAYIEELDSKTTPFEYKLLDYQPEKWTNLKSVLIMKYVAAMLTGYEEDVTMAHMYAALGKTEFRKIYPEYQGMENDDFDVFQNLKIDSLPYADHINYEFLTNKSRVSSSSYNPRLGSNNWAISAEKSTTGNPILCNDPHLGLSLPSIWYEIQLASNTTNVYGVSIPGTIGVIIGFNQTIAWGVTNGSTDVRDWYKLKLKDNYSAYELDGKWISTKVQIEKILVKNQAPIYDTIYSTIHGPIVIDDRFNQTPDVQNYALKWTLHESSNEFLTFLHLNKAKNYDDFKEAISHYKCPTQNFVYASSDNTIAIHHQGLLYEKWNGQGRFLMDGTKKSHLYEKAISAANLPQMLNPASNFVHSANNFPSYDTLHTYINGNYSEVRAYQIQRKLSANKKFSIEDMKKLQLDNENCFATLVLPELLHSLKKQNKTTDKYQKTVDLLSKWNYQFDKESRAAGFFNLWWIEIERLTWDELQIQDYFMKYPDPTILSKLILTDQKSKYFDKLHSEKVETFEDISREAFLTTLKKFDNKKWGDINSVRIMHLSQVEALSIYNLHLNGHPGTLNAISENWGPSWRMIVELGDRPKAYGIYPGGQSGNIASSKYDGFVKDWSIGKYYELNYFLNKFEASKLSKKSFKITGK